MTGKEYKEQDRINRTFYTHLWIHYYLEMWLERNVQLQPQPTEFDRSLLIWKHMEQAII